MAEVFYGRTILVIYTGGTIGMLLGDQGYQPEPHYLTSSLRNQPRFNDPLGESLFSNSSSVQAWRTHRSGATTPTGQPVEGSNQTPFPVDPTVLVRSTRPIVSPDIVSPSVKVAEDVYETVLPALITPSSSTDERIRYAVLEASTFKSPYTFSTENDYSNIENDDWIRLATEIEINYTFDAFIILHGTDTICYTSSALSFLLEDLGKTVIITGAQIPLSQLRNDAVDNLLGSLSIASRFIIPECCLYFNHTLYRGNRVSKASSFDLNAFSSPNYPPLVNVGIDIIVNWNDVIMPRETRRFRAHKAMCPDVATLRLFPGISAASARTFLSPPIKGVILESFGSGNAPQRKDLMTAIKDACDRGIVVVTISQCAKGSVSADYATGRSLADVGVVPGADMTPEAALTKLSYLLSKPELSTTEIRNLMSIPLRGELTVPAIMSQNVPTSLESIKGVMSHLLRLSVPQPSSIPSITVSHSSQPPALNQKTKDVTASWSLTASDADSSQAAILPFLIHLAVAKDDIDGLQFCLKASDALSVQHADTVAMTASASGIVNALDTAARAPLHTAALHGSLECVRLLLQSGGSVHLRDALDHTCLYYAARQGHDLVVQVLDQAGANLAGADLTMEHAFLKDKPSRERWQRLSRRNKAD